MARKEISDQKPAAQVLFSVCDLTEPDVEIGMGKKKSKDRRVIPWETQPPAA